MINIPQIEKAHEVITPYIQKTPLIYSEVLSELFQAEIYLKCENFQKTGSFKIRGAINKLLSLDKSSLKNGVVAASAGNHAQGVAAAAKLFDVPCTIVMPKTSPLVKIQNTRALGAEVILFGNFYDYSYKKALEIAKERNACLIHPFADEKIMAGQGTVGKEILEDLNGSGFDFLFCPIGGGGICSGIGTYFKGKSPLTKIIGISTVNAPSMVRSIQEGKIVEFQNKQSFADGLNIKAVDKQVFEYLKTIIHQAVLVEEDSIIVGMGVLLERCKMLVEGSAAVTVAHLIENQKEYHNKKICLVLTGANVDLSLAGDIADRYLNKTRRHVWLKMEILDKPGALAKITNIFADHNVNILQIFQEHSLSKALDFYQTEVKVELEFEGKQHYEQIKGVLKEEKIPFERI